MAVLPILEFPDPRLRTVAKPVTLFDAELKALVADMRETMYAAEGIGLAASQIDVHQRILVIDVSETKDSPRAVCRYPDSTRRSRARGVSSLRPKTKRAHRSS